MLIYVVVALLSFLLLNLSKKTSEIRKKRVLICLSFLTLFIVSAIRFNVGTDYNSYIEWFKGVNFPYFSYTNFLFNNLIILIKLFTTNPQWLFVVTSFIILFLVYKTAVNNYEEYDMIVFLFVALGFYFSTFNGVRQWIAIAIFIYSYKYIINNNFFKYLFCIIIASMFHITAILLLPVYWLFKIKVKDKQKILIFFLSLFIFKVLNLYVVLAFFLKKFAFGFYVRYIASGVDLTKSVGSFMPILLCGGMLLFYILFKYLLLENMSEKQYLQHKNLCFILSIFSIVNTVNNLFSRFSYYFIPFIVFLLPDFFCIFNKKYKRYMKIIVIILGVSFMVINTVLKNSNNPLPYVSIFD